jgi:hypothetical protein
LGIGEPLLGVAHLSLSLATTGGVGSLSFCPLELGRGRFQGILGLSGRASITRRGLQCLRRGGEGLGELLIDSGEVLGPGRKLGGGGNHLCCRGTRESVGQVAQLLGSCLTTRQWFLGEALFEPG